MNNFDDKAIESAFKLILKAIGEDCERQGLQDTPMRIAKMYKEIFSGLNVNLEDQIQTYFDEDYHDMVIVKDIPVQSICEHHFMPFFGLAHVVYIPKNGRITGLSKLVRVVDMACKKPQLQERLTNEIAHIIDKKLNPEGVFVRIEAEHMCISYRGIKKIGTKTITCCKTGVFENSINANQALSLI